MALLEYPEFIHLMLQIPRIHTVDKLLDLLFKLGLTQRHIQAPRVQQLIQEQGMPGQKRYDPGTGSGQLDQMGQGLGIFKQQGHIAGTAAD